MSDSSLSSRRRCAVWIDFGGVLTGPAHETLTAFCTAVEVSAEQLVGAIAVVARSYGTDDPMEPLDTPLVDAETWTGEVEQALRDRFEIEADLSDFATKWFSGRPPNQPLIDHLGTLRARGHFIGMLSNMVPAFEPHWPRIANPNLFDDLVFSYKVGARKPQRAIYDIATARAGVAARHCILVDDLPANCEGARKAGWRAVQHVPDGDTVAALESLLAVG